MQAIDSKQKTKSAEKNLFFSADFFILRHRVNGVFEAQADPTVDR